MDMIRHRMPSYKSIPNWRHNSLNTFPVFARCLPNIAFLRYYGYNFIFQHGQIVVADRRYSNAEMLARKRITLHNRPDAWQTLAEALRALGREEDACRAEALVLLA